MQELTNDKGQLEKQIQDCKDAIQLHKEENDNQFSHVMSLNNFISEAGKKKGAISQEIENARQQKARYVEELSNIQGTNKIYQK